MKDPRILCAARFSSKTNEYEPFIFGEETKDVRKFEKTHFIAVPISQLSHHTSPSSPTLPNTESLRASLFLVMDTLKSFSKTP